jgi:hypothetical protein
LNSDIAEDRSQEALALAWMNFRHHALQGHILDDGILVNFARHRAEDLGRQVVPCGGRARKFCVMDQRNYVEGKVEVLRLDKIMHDRGEANLLGLAEAMAANPVRRIISALDLQAWLASLPEDDQVLLSMRMAGYRLKPIAKRLGISTSAAWARCRELGYELAERAHVEVPGEGRCVGN